MKLMKTVLQELMNEFENIKLTKCKTMQEMMFFDGVLAIIESKYIEKEKEQIEKAFEIGYDNGACVNEGEDIYHGSNYYKKHLNYENIHI